MIWLNIMFLAVVQGIAEFLPVSSSGHLLILKELLGFNSPGVRLEVVLHLGTLLAVVVYFRRRLLWLIMGILRRERGPLRLAALLLLSVLPAGLVWMLSGRYLEPLLADHRHAAIVASLLLWITGLLLLSARKVAGGGETVSVRQAWWIGVAQGFAVFPGISRSGSTITVGRHLGLSAPAAVEFSFLMSIPVLLASAAVDFFINRAGPAGIQIGTAQYLAGALVSAGVGYMAIGTLVRMLGRGRYTPFALYCFSAGAVSLLWLWFRG